MAAIQCVNCKISGHSTGSSSCPLFVKIQKKNVKKTKADRKKTFAEMVRALNPNSSVSDSQSSELLTGEGASLQSMFPSSSSSSVIFPTVKRGENVKAK